MCSYLGVFSRFYVANSVLFFQFTIYFPLSSVSIIPTANSAQMSRSRTKRATQTATRYLIFFIFLIASSHNRPVPSNRPPATTKSIRVQFTSSVICIAIIGMSNNIAVMSRIIISLLFCINSNVPIGLKFPDIYVWINILHIT